jgi:hypothetical protein
MSNTPNPVMGMVNDPEFQKLQLSDQRRALSGLDKSFGSLSDADFTRVSQGLKSSTTPSAPFPGGPVPGAPGGVPPPVSSAPYPGALSPTAPTTNQNMALAMSGQQGQMTPENQSQFESGKAAGTITGANIASLGPAVSGGIAALPAVGRGIAGGLGGSYVGGHAGQYLGKLTGIPELEPIGAAIGGIGGALGLGGSKIPTNRAEMIEMLMGKGQSLPKTPAVDVTEEGAVPQDLINRMKKLVIPGQEPTAADLKRAGDLTQAPLPVLKALAKFGDKLATNEINRRVRGMLVKP